MDPSAFVYVALSGEQEFGRSSGVVIVDPANSHAKYTLLDELVPREFANNISDEMQKNPANLYVATKDKNHLHVFAYDRATAMTKLKMGQLPLT